MENLEATEKPTESKKSKNMALRDITMELGALLPKFECYISVEQWQHSAPICTKTSINFVECYCLNNY